MTREQQLARRELRHALAGAVGPLRHLAEKALACADSVLHFESAGVARQFAARVKAMDEDDEDTITGPLPHPLARKAIKVHGKILPDEKQPEDSGRENGRGLSSPGGHGEV